MCCNLRCFKFSKIYRTFLMHSSRQRVPIHHNGPPLPPSKLPLRMGIWTPIENMVPLAHPSLHPIGISIGSARFVGLTIMSERQTDRQTDKPVCVYGRDCAPSSECLQFRMPPSFDRCTPPRRRFNQNMLPSVVLLQQYHCRNRHTGKFKIYRLRQSCSNRVDFFAIHRRHRRKK